MTKGNTMIATKAHWKCSPMPEEHEVIKLEKQFTSEEFDEIKKGLVPAQMEDKWFIYCENEELYMHRSWTGVCVYQTSITPSEKGTFILSSFKANASASKYPMEAPYHTKLFEYLIDRLLLSKPIPFPSLDASLSNEGSMIERHSIVGYGQTRKEINELQNMAEIQYVKGDATAPVGDGNKIIVHICNDIGGWGKGFVRAISKKWKAPEAAYRKWYKSQEGFALGQVQHVRIEDDLWVANLIGQHKIYKDENGDPPVRYDAIRIGLAEVAQRAQKLSASVHMPRIGCGLAGGKWEQIEPILDQELVALGVQTTVYDL